MSTRLRALATLVAIAAVGAVGQPAVAAHWQQIDVQSLACVAEDVTLLGITTEDLTCTGISSTNAAPNNMMATQFSFETSWTGGGACPTDGAPVFVFYEDPWGRLTVGPVAASNHWILRTSQVGPAVCTLTVSSGSPDAGNVIGTGSYSGMSHLGPSGLTVVMPAHTIDPVDPLQSPEASVVYSVDNS